MFLSRKKISLSEMQQKILKSGWGKDSVDETIIEKIIYYSDDLKVHGYLAYPKNQDKKYPCIIWCRGGFEDAGALDDFYAQGILGQLASWGYVVFETQYRGNVGGEGKDEFGGKDLEDVFNLIPLAKELAFAKPNIWGIEGWSRGGMMTYLALTRSHNFKAAISTGGISNIKCNVEESGFMKRLLSKNNSELNEKFCNDRSILNKVHSFTKSTPILLVHGLNDKRVPPHHSLDLSTKLIENKLPHRLVLLENGDHFLRSHKKEVDEMRKNWFKKYLKE